ncbi:Chalcone-flavanone isomerase family protein [Heracleum sosnowskyi]|uniref:Chalcone-flavanone isomerase family protein n=1 Tax=Heracleum sosnowskyi TaxID=360622 RepID=A0AAD8H978_9APIA|nr:Chalcone-flavanone isomerase family protein [Heracleum sosnowskyi]
METPSSARRITRSHAFAASNNTIPFSTNDQKGVSKTTQKSGKKQQDRSALFDITNDSPIVGLAMGNLSTPSSGFSKTRRVISNHCSDNNFGSTTPGSGEALLRSQVESLLQKVEEEGDILKFSLEDVGGPFVHLKGLLANSPMALFAPTPTNTPSVYGTQGVEKIGLVSGVSTPVLEQVSITKMVTEIIDMQNKKEEESLITRSLLFDFYEKSEVSSNSSDCVSTMTSQGGSAESKAKLFTDDGDDDNASMWSLQVNASSKDEEDADDDVEVESDYYTYDYEEEEDFDDDAALDDEICEGLSKISVNGPKFSGKHTRFVCDSDDDELAAQEEDCGDVVADSPPEVLRLKGLPTPKGKHLRFQLED